MATKRNLLQYTEINIFKYLRAVFSRISCENWWPDNLTGQPISLKLHRSPREITLTSYGSAFSGLIAGALRCSNIIIIFFLLLARIASLCGWLKTYGKKRNPLWKDKKSSSDNGWEIWHQMCWLLFTIILQLFEVCLQFTWSFLWKICLDLRVKYEQSLNISIISLAENVLWGMKCLKY